MTTHHPDMVDVPRRPGPLRGRDVDSEEAMTLFHRKDHSVFPIPSIRSQIRSDCKISRFFRAPALCLMYLDPTSPRAGIPGSLGTFPFFERPLLKLVFGGRLP